MKSLIEKMLFPVKKIYWRKKNKHNRTIMGKNFATSRVSVGKGTYGPLNVYTFDNEDEFLQLGNYCSIGPEVVFLLGGEHDYKNFSTYPFKNFFNNESESITKGKVVVEDDVWIGYGATILSGIRIGKGAVVGAKSVVTRDVPDYAIVAGNPAKVLKYRFDEEIINELKKFDYSKIEGREKIYIDKFYKNMDIEDVKNIINGEQI